MKTPKLLLKKISRNFLLLFFLLLLSVACGNRDDSVTPEQQLPAETQSGANTFGCLVNGKLFFPRDGVPSVASNGTPKGLEVIGSPTGFDYREIEASNFKDGKPINYFTLHLQSLNSLGTGVYNLKQSNFKRGLDGIMDNYFLIRAFDYNEGIWKWYGSYDGSGKITITRYDSTNFIISGTFSGKVRTEDGNNEIEITQGRFDIKTTTLNNKEFP